MEFIDATKILQSFITHINSKRNLSFLFGAGISISYVPAIEKITSNIEDIVKASGDADKIYAWDCLKEEAEDNLRNFNIEYVFSALSNKLIAIGKEKLLNMNFDNLKEFKSYLIELFNDEITKNIKADSEGTYDKIIENSPHLKFAEWLAHRNSSTGIEIFTPNYDYLLELAFESQKIKYFDGFSGGFIPYFDSTAIENINYRESDTKLWKIHGSLGWSEQKNNIVKMNTNKNRVLILPSSLKYDETKKLPYGVLLDRLASSLKGNESTLIICGYSFNDYHINDIITNSLKNNRSAQVFAFVYDKQPLNSGESCNITSLKNCNNKFSVVNGSHYEAICKQTNQLTLFGFRTVINRGETYVIRMSNYPEVPNNDLLYFSYDTEKDPDSGKDVCNGFGELKICDFKEMSTFFMKMAGE